MKKILLLGGSEQQVIAIKTAQKLGYYTILCDYLEDNPGQNAADKFFLISTTDKEAVLKVAMDENIDGILAYASDPAAPTAAYVSEIMGLPGFPLQSVEILCNKDLFRDFLNRNGFNVPRAMSYRSYEEVCQDIDNFEFPVLVKPVDSSGSKGISIQKNMYNLRSAFEFANSFSRCGRVIIEEFITQNHPYLIGGDILVVNGCVKLWGLLNCHRDQNVNKLVPVGKSYPLFLTDKDIFKVKETLQSLVSKLNMTTGAMNVELMIDDSGKVWPIDIGPRCGGNLIPDLLGYIWGIDIPEFLIKSAMGESTFFNIKESESCYATYNLHSQQNGKLKNIWFSDYLQKYIIKKHLYSMKGDYIEYFDNAAKALGVIFMRFPTREVMFNLMDSIEREIHIELDSIEEG